MEEGVDVDVKEEAAAEVEVEEVVVEGEATDRGDHEDSDEDKGEEEEDGEDTAQALHAQGPQCGRDDARVVVGGPQGEEGEECAEERLEAVRELPAYLIRAVG